MGDHLREISSTRGPAVHARCAASLLGTAQQDGFLYYTMYPPPRVQRTLCPTNTSCSDRIF